ncbi:MAG: serine--tRNA ligase, partial [bacterium]
MLTLKMITENRDEVVRKLGRKYYADAEKSIDQVIALDAKRRATQQELDTTLAQANQYSKTIGLLMKEGKRDEAEAAKADVAALKERSKTLQTEMEAVEIEIKNILHQVPNLPNDTVPEGRHAEDNLVEREGGVNPVFEGFEPLPHWDLAKK